MIIQWKLRGALPLFGSLLLLGGCVDQSPTEPPANPPRARESITCTAWVAEETLLCTPSNPGREARSTLLVGGQDTLAGLFAERVAFDPAAGELHVHLALRNLLPMPMGTPDGTTATGSRIFVVSGPVVIAGGGTVDVANADGMAAITAPRQPYFTYPEIIPSNAASASRLWTFRMAPAVEAFEIQLYVETRLPFERGVLRWVPRATLPRDCRATCAAGELRAAWGIGSTVYATGWVEDSKTVHGAFFGPEVRPGAIARTSDGGSTWAVDRSVYWDPEATDRFKGARVLNDLWGPDTTTLYAVGWQYSPADYMYHGVIVRAAGGWSNGFDVLAVFDSIHYLLGVWGSGANDVYAVGSGRRGTCCPPSPEWGVRGVLLHSADGGGRWTTTWLDAGLASVWGSGPGDVYVTGNAGIHHSTDGGRTWTLAGGTTGVGRIWGLDAGHVWAVGRRGADGLILYSTDGGRSWTETLVPNVWLSGVWASSPEDVYVVGARGTVLRFDGRSWREMPTGHPALHLVDVWGTTAENVLVFGDNGTVLHGMR
jgi:photosystem II stability/assembly factor-like uncharacterized protein